MKSTARSGKWYILIVSIIILAISVFLVAILNYFNYAKNLKSLTNTRFWVTAQDVTTTIEYGLNLGLSLRELNALERLITETGKKNPDISDLFVMDENGTQLFNARGIVKNIAPAFGRKIKTIDMNVKSSFFTNGYHVLVAPITNQFNVRVGNLVLLYSAEQVNIPLQQAAKRFLMNSIIVFLAGTLILQIAVNFIYSGFLVSIGLFHAGLVKLSTGDSPDSRKSASASTAFEPVFSEFSEKTKHVMAKLTKTGEALEKIEREF